MILEIAELRVQPDVARTFLRNAAAGVELFRDAIGCEGMQVRRSTDSPSEYRLLVRWRTLENHLVDFRQSDGLLEWRGLTAHLLEQPPVIGNWELAVPGFGLA